MLMRWDEPDGRGRLRSESVESQIRKSGRCPSCACGPAGWISDPAGRPPHWARPEPSRLQIVDPLAVTGHTEKHPGFPVGRTTCPGDVPADPADWRLHAGPSTDSPTPHQDWHRGTQTPHTLENGQRLVRLFPLSGNFPESCPAPVAIRPPAHGNPGSALQSIQKGGSAALIATGARLCPALASRETPDAFGVALHHGHRNAKIVSRRHKVVVERCHFNRITQCMSGASLDEFVVPEHPSHHPAKDLSAQGGIPEEWLRFRVAGEIDTSLPCHLQAFARRRQRCRRCVAVPEQRVQTSGLNERRPKTAGHRILHPQVVQHVRMKAGRDAG